MNSLEQKVLELIGENTSSPDVFLDTDAGMAPIRDSISDAVAEIAMLTGGFKREYYLPLRADVGFYRLRLQYGDVGWITDVWSHNRQHRMEQTDLLRLNAHDPRWMVHSADPASYLHIGRDIIGFYPKPSAASDVMIVSLVEIPHAYSAERDRVKLRDSFKYATVQYAVAEYWASRGDAAEASAHMQLYMDALGIKRDYTQQSERAPYQRTQKEPWPTVTS